MFALIAVGVAVMATLDAGDDAGNGGSHHHHHQVRDYHEMGFFVMPSLLTRSYALAYHDQVKEHVAAFGSHYKFMMGGTKTGGWYISSLQDIDELRHVITTVKQSMRLRAVLSSLLGRS